MAQQVTIQYCGMEGTGSTVTKAKQDATRKIEFILSGDWTPFVITHHGWIAMIARTPMIDAPWGYKLLQVTDATQNLYLASHYGTREETIAGAAYHVAQNAGTYVGLERWIAPGKQRELDDYFAWQAEYARAKAQGHSDQTCWDMATAARAGR